MLLVRGNCTQSNLPTSVETNSDVIPKARGEIIICADGIRSSRDGFALSEGLCEEGKVRPRIGYLLANADVSAGVIEHFLSSDPLLNYRCFWTHHKSVSFFGVQSSTAFYELKERGDNVISRKLKDAYPLEVSGHARGSSGKYAKYFENMVRDNVIFVRVASGGAGNIHGMIQGKFAGTVEASAIRETNISEERLSEYQDLVLGTLGKAPFFWFSAREDFGSFNDWFREFEASTKGIKATELSHFR